jgi:serine/threonine protein kinase
LREEIARGGMGAIHAARDLTLNREVAVKVLRDEFRTDPKHARRFVTEGQITGQLQHPAIPPVHDLGTLPDGCPFLAMKLIRGRTLADLLSERAEPQADQGRFIAVFEQICQAVGYAHSRGVVHRDLKPQNVMVGAFGEVQVMDWGLAKILPGEAGLPPPPSEWPVTAPPDGAQTGAGSILGTPAFMPPEQAGGDASRVDKRADVFGLGAMLAVILTGSPPYVGANARAVVAMAARGDLAAAFTRLEGSGADPALVALAKQCLARDPADRPADAGAVAAATAAFRERAEERAKRAELELEKRRLRKIEVVGRWRTMVLTLVGVGLMLVWSSYAVLSLPLGAVLAGYAGIMGLLAFLGFWLIGGPQRAAGYRLSDLWARGRAEQVASADRPCDKR